MINNFFNIIINKTTWGKKKYYSSLVLFHIRFHQLTIMYRIEKFINRNEGKDKGKRHCYEEGNNNQEYKTKAHDSEVCLPIQWLHMSSHSYLRPHINSDQSKMDKLTSH